MKYILQNYSFQIIVIIFYVIFIVTVAIVLWETFTSQSIVDKIWDFMEKRKNRRLDDGNSE